MSEGRWVEVVAYEKDVVVKRLGPMSQWKAEKVDGGLNINLAHERFFTRIVDK